jgi:outer membrane receptor protein involved in Fe transport
MNCRNLPPRFWLAPFFALAGAFAQTAPASAGASATATDKDIVELSAFAVSGQREIGYQATTTVSASRLNVPLKEVPLNIAVPRRTS